MPSNIRLTKQLHTQCCHKNSCTFFSEVMLQVCVLKIDAQFMQFPTMIPWEPPEKSTKPLLSWQEVFCSLFYQYNTGRKKIGTILSGCSVIWGTTGVLYIMDMTFIRFITLKVDFSMINEMFIPAVFLISNTQKPFFGQFDGYYWVRHSQWQNVSFIFLSLAKKVVYWKAIETKWKKRKQCTPWLAQFYRSYKHIKYIKMLSLTKWEGQNLEKKTTEHCFTLFSIFQNDGKYFSIGNYFISCIRSTSVFVPWLTISYTKGNTSVDNSRKLVPFKHVALPNSFQ